jgi:hypothetical protein
MLTIWGILCSPPPPPHAPSLPLPKSVPSAHSSVIYRSPYKLHREHTTLNKHQKLNFYNTSTTKSHHNTCMFYIPGNLAHKESNQCTYTRYTLNIHTHSKYTTYVDLICASANNTWTSNHISSSFHCTKPKTYWSSTVCIRGCKTCITTY